MFIIMLPLDVSNNAELIKEVLLVEMQFLLSLWNEQRKISMREENVVQFMLIIVYFFKVKHSLPGSSKKIKR